MQIDNNQSILLQGVKVNERYLVIFQKSNEIYKSSLLRLKGR